MDDRNAPPWHAMAAYLYVLQLDGPSLAWEYLRRNPDYRRDWQERRHDAARAWGLRLLEDPARDAREAVPVWCPDPDAVLQLRADDDPLHQSVVFEFWRIPGRKELVHDGHRLLLAVRAAGCCLRLALSAGLDDGMAYVHAIPAGPSTWTRHRAVADALEGMASAVARDAATQARPSSTALLEQRTLQALDATLAGASLRDVAEGLFGADLASGGWHTDGGLRSRVRRLVRRGRALMRGGYRHAYLGHRSHLTS